MIAHVTVRRFGLRQICGRYWPMASGAIVALALASGIAVTFGTVAERLTVYWAAAPAVSGVRISMSAPRVADRRYDAVWAAKSASFPHVVDRWFDEPAAAASITSSVADR